MACSMTAVSCFMRDLTLYPAESLHWRREIGMSDTEAAGPGGRPRQERFRKGANPMYSNIVVVFNFILSQWSLTPQAFKEAVLAAALAKCVLAVIWWTTRMLVAKFPANPALSAWQKMLETRPAKLVVLILDITLIDVFLFFAGVALLDLSQSFSVFSLWSAMLFAFLLVYMVMVAHKDIKKY